MLCLQDISASFSQSHGAWGTHGGPEVTLEMDPEDAPGAALSVHRELYFRAGNSAPQIHTTGPQALERERTVERGFPPSGATGIKGHHALPDEPRGHGTGPM